MSNNPCFTICDKRWSKSFIPVLISHCPLPSILNSRLISVSLVALLTVAFRLSILLTLYLTEGFNHSHGVLRFADTDTEAVFQQRLVKVAHQDSFGL